jgi:2'-5' RNA ligase/endonuclease/exonuclease/phosphatase family metal-dependent hydrolase
MFRSSHFLILNLFAFHQVNLLYPFVESTSFAAAVQIIAPILRQFEPFRVSFVEFGSFEHRASTTVWLRPETSPPNVLVRLHNALRAAFPHCDDLDTKSDQGYNPHMTVAQVKGPSRGALVARLREQFVASWQRLEFTVDTLFLLAREDDTPFAVYYDLPLGLSPSRAASAALRTSEQRLQPRSTYRYHDAAGEAGAWRPVDVAEQQRAAKGRLVVLRGPSGSGKSRSVAEILTQSPGGVAFSTDDFFIDAASGDYVFRFEALAEAHEWNRARAIAAIDAGRSPVVIDNTNLEAWEAAPYVRRALLRGYNVEIRDSDSPWCRDAAELARRNAHGVPVDRIEVQLARWTKYTVADALAAATPSGASIPASGAAASTTMVTSSSNANASSVTDVTILTYNLLFDAPDEAGRFDSATLEPETRLQCALDVIERSNADIVCLQEVTKATLTVLLACGFVRERYFASEFVDASGGGETVVPYGQVTLAKRAFETSVLPLSSVKRVTATRFQIGSHTVLLCNVHLPSSVGKNGAARRLQHLNAVLSLAEQDHADHVLIVGDTNMEPTETIATFDDAWLALGRTDEQGFTFDPERNPTAKITSIRGVSRRYDRVLFHSRRGSIAPHAAALSGTQTISPQHYASARRTLALCPSDHYALSVTLSLSADERSRTQATLARVLEPHSYAHARVVIAAARACAVLLRQACAKRGATIIVVPVGSLAVGVATTESDADVLCVGTIARDQFIAIVRAALSNASHCTPLRDVPDAVVPIFTARVVGVDVDILYSQVTRTDVLASADALVAAVSGEKDGTLFASDESARAVGGLVDASRLQRAVDDATLLNVFRPLARLVRAWAKFHGIYTNRFGFVGGFGWCCAVMAVVQRRTDAAETLEQAARRFFRELAAQDWKKPLGIAGSARPKLAALEAPPTIGVVTPTGVYCARHSTRSSRVMVERCFERAAEIVSGTDVDWYDLFVPLPSRWTVVFEVSISAGSMHELRDWYAHVTNRLASFTERVLQTCADDVHVVCLADERPYAADFRLDGPFAARHYVTLESHSRALQLGMAPLCAQWLQGLHAWSLRKSSMIARVEQRQSVPSSAVPLRWSAVDNDDDEFSYHELEDRERIAMLAWSQSDATLEPILAAMVRELDHVDSDDDDNNAGSGDDDDNSGDKGDDNVTDDNAEPQINGDDAAKKSEAKKAKQQKKKQKGKRRDEEEEVIQKQRLRPAHIVYKQILFDGHLNATQFFVVWEDRHLGLVDQAVLEYDIENVPLHRVRRFERVQDDGTTREVVWCREKRIDLLKKPEVHNDKKTH